MENKIFDLLNKFGIPCHIKGRKYIETAIKIVYSNTNVSITKELYPKIAEIHKTTSSRVERLIRHAIEISFDMGGKDNFEKVFGNTVNYESKKIANCAFIFGVVEYLKVYEAN